MKACYYNKLMLGFLSVFLGLTLSQKSFSLETSAIGDLDHLVRWCSENFSIKNTPVSAEEYKMKFPKQFYASCCINAKAQRQKLIELRGPHAQEWALQNRLCTKKTTDRPVLCEKLKNTAAFAQLHFESIKKKGRVMESARLSMEDSYIEFDKICGKYYKIAWDKAHAKATLSPRFDTTGMTPEQIRVEIERLVAVEDIGGSDQIVADSKYPDVYTPCKSAYFGRISFCGDIGKMFLGFSTSAPSKEKSKLVSNIFVIDECYTSKGEFVSDEMCSGMTPKTDATGNLNSNVGAGSGTVK